MKLLRPRSLVLAAVMAVSLLAVSCGGGSSSPTGGSGTASVPMAKVTFQLNWLPNVQHFGPVYASRQGLYKEMNLDVDLKPGGQGIDGLQMVVGGAADIALSSAPNLFAANEKGADLVAFAAVFQSSASALVCRQDRKISTFSDIAGKNFGSKGPSDEDKLPRLLKKTGIDPKNIKIRPIGASSITEIIAGVVDCQLAFAVNEPITMRKAGVEPVVFHLSDYGLGGQGEIYITRRDFYEKNPEVLVRFLQATAKAWNVFLDDPTAAAQYIGDSKLIDGLDVEQQKGQAKAMAGLISSSNTKENGLLYLNKELWEQQAAQTLEEGRITKLPDMEKVRPFTILQKASLPKR